MRFLSIKEFSSAAHISPQSVYKQLNKRLKPYLHIINGRKLIDPSALSLFYGVELDVQPDSTDIQPDSTDFQPKEEKVEQPIQPDSTQVEQPHIIKILEERTRELKRQLEKQEEEYKNEITFLRDQVTQKDRVIEALTETLRLSQQLAVAEKLLLEKEQDDEDVEDKNIEIITSYDHLDNDNQQPKHAQQNEKRKGMKAFFQRLLR